MSPNFTKFGIEARNESRNSNLCFFSLFEKGCGQPRPFHVLRKLMYEFLFWMTQSDPLLYYNSLFSTIWYSIMYCKGGIFNPPEPDTDVTTLVGLNKQLREI